ncbi:MAG: 3-phosphoshikimate 1-carboxyvinyltransferase [Citrobacter freundii]|nr:MAG: 3-phosphoshikimate 1-carboxyvinyltransferase [Citrobacter freundii]
MKVTIQPGSLKGTIQSPASKSSMQRACAAALVAKGISEIYNPGHSNDDKAAMDIIRRLGAKLEDQPDGTLQVSSEGIKPVAPFIDCGESGLSIRMFTPLVALSAEEITIKGSGSLVTRPMDFFDEILPQIGVKVQSNSGKLPLVIQGPLKPANISVDGSLSSQFLTGLLLAYAAADASDVSIRVNNLKSRPYIDLTLDVMKRFGLKTPENRNYEEFYFRKESVGEEPAHRYTVEGDWSGGAFLLVAGAVAGPITVRGLDIASTQADKAILQALMNANAGIALDAKEIQLHPAKLSAFEFDATDCPDLFPPLVALASYCEGETRIKGVSRLAHKESDRGLTLQEEFGKMGVAVHLEGDIMRIEGGGGVNGAVVSSRHDHRIAMACAVASLKAAGETTIEHAEAINKSYPDFYNDLRQLGAVVSLNSQFKLHE